MWQCVMAFHNLGFQVFFYSFWSVDVENLQILLTELYKVKDLKIKRARVMRRHFRAHPSTTGSLRVIALAAIASHSSFCHYVYVIRLFKSQEVAERPVENRSFGTIADSESKKVS